MKLTADQVKRVSKLANLPLEDEEVSKYSEQLSAILEYIEQLNKVNTKDVAPTFNVTGQENVLAEDEIRPSLSQEEATLNAQNKKNGLIAVKGIFEDE